MAAKRNRWLIGTVLIVALGAFLSLSLLPILGSAGDRNTAKAPEPTASQDPAQVQAELESQAKGYELVLEREPENQTALRGLVDTRIQMGDVQGVIAPLEKLAELNPELTDYAVLLGQAKQQVGDLDGAAQAYRSVLDQQPGNMNALQGLVALLVQQNRPQAAIGLLQDTLTTANQLATDGNGNSIDEVSVKLLLAQVYVEDNQIDQAMALYDEAIAEGSDDFRPLLAKALVLKQQGRQDEAKPLFDQALTLAPAQYKDQIQTMQEDGTEPASEANPEINSSSTPENSLPSDSPGDSSENSDSKDAAPE